MEIEKLKVVWAKYCEIKQQRRLFASADFYCEILSAGIYTEMGFYSRVKIKGHRPSGT